MAQTLFALALAATAALALPQPTKVIAPRDIEARATSTAAAAASGNPFVGKQMYANTYYSSEVVNIAIPSLPSSLKAAASQVADTPSFFWMDTHSKVPQ